MLQLLKATKNEIELISKLAQTIWNQHYIPIIGEEQVNYMLDKMYNYDSLIEQLEVKKHTFYIIIKNDVNLGFLSISSENNIDFFLNKLYINQQFASNGIGTKVLQEIEKIISPKTISLTVNRQNFKSINFYFKNGFKIKSVENFDIGNGYEMNDFVMEKRV